MKNLSTLTKGFLAVMKPSKIKKQSAWKNRGCSFAFAIAASAIAFAPTANAATPAQIVTDDVNAELHLLYPKLASPYLEKATAAQVQAAVQILIFGLPASSTATPGDFSSVNAYALQTVTTIVPQKTAAATSIVTGAMIGTGSNGLASHNAADFNELIAAAAGLTETQKLALGKPVATALLSLAANVAGGVSLSLTSDASRQTLATNIAGIALVGDYSNIANQIAAPATTAIAKGNIAENVAVKSISAKMGADPVNGAAAIAKIVAQQVGVSSADQGLIAGSVAGATGAKEFAAQIAKEVASLPGADMGLVAASVAAAQLTMAPAINTSVLALISGSSFANDQDRIAISGSIANVKNITIGSVLAISGTTTGLISGSNAAALTTGIITSLQTLDTSANKNSIAVQIAKSLKTADVQYGVSVAKAAAAQVNDAASANGKGTIAMNIAALPGFTGYAADIANEVALTTSGSLAYEVAIAKKVATNKVVADAGEGLRVAKTVEETSLSELNQGNPYSDYLLKAQGCANVAANYASAITKYSKEVAGHAANFAVLTIENDATSASNNTTGVNYYKVAKMFGITLAASNSKSAAYKKTTVGIGSVVYTGVGTLAYSSAPALATAIGLDLENRTIASVGGSATAGTAGFNLTEVFAAVGVALTHNLLITDVTNISGVINALAQIDPKSAPDLLGTVLTDLNIRTTGGLPFTSATSPAYKLYSNLLAVLGASSPEKTYVDNVMTKLFGTTVPASKVKFLAEAKSIFRTYDDQTGIGYAAGKIVGDETPIYNF